MTDEEEIFDPFCDPMNPKIITFPEVASAAFLIKGSIERTPCPRSTSSESYGMDLYWKKEFLQYTGSFKERGARHAMMLLTDEQKEGGVVAASAGNHAQGVSYHGMLMNIPVTVVMPKTAPLMKIQNCLRYKANVVVEGKDMAEAKFAAMTIGKEQGMFFLNGYDHPHVISGVGTIGLEILQQVPQPDAIILPIGGGGLIAGVGSAVKMMSPNTLIIGVESEKCPAFSAALSNNGPIFTPPESTIAEGLAVPVVGYNSYATAAPLIDKMVVVKEEWISLAILRLVEEEKCVVEGAGACGLAAILAGQLDELKGKRVVVVLSGGNIDTTTLGRCLESSLASEGRLVKFRVEVSDRPGGINDLCNKLGDLGVSIKEISHERAWLKDIYMVEVKVVCETRDWPHSMELRNHLQTKYEEVEFQDTPIAVTDSGK